MVSPLQAWFTLHRLSTVQCTVYIPLERSSVKLWYLHSWQRIVAPYSRTRPWIKDTEEATSHATLQMQHRRCNIADATLQRCDIRLLGTLKVACSVSNLLRSIVRPTSDKFRTDRSFATELAHVGMWCAPRGRSRSRSPRRFSASWLVRCFLSISMPAACCL